jgi:opacity protein-like surface antigen
MKLFIAAAAAAFLLATPALAEDLHITVMTELYVSHVGTNSWEENILPESAEPGASQPVDIEDGRSTCNYDIKAVFSDGGTAEFRNQNLCETSTFSVHD